MDLVFTVLRVAVSLAAVLAIIWYAHRRLSRGSRHTTKINPVSVIGKKPVGSKANVVVVEADGQRFLLGVTEHTVTVLHSSDAPVAEVSPVRSFEEALAQSSLFDNIDVAAHSENALTRPGDDSLKAPVKSLFGSSVWKHAFTSVRQGLR